MANAMEDTMVSIMVNTTENIMDNTTAKDMILIIKSVIFSKERVNNERKSFT